jgi:hypothetical protein
MLNEMSYLQLKRLTGEEEEVLISEHKQLKKALGRQMFASSVDPLNRVLASKRPSSDQPQERFNCFPSA